MSTLFQQKEMKLSFEHATGQFGGLHLDHRTGLAPEEEDNAKSLFLHGKIVQKMSTFVLQKEKKLDLVKVMVEKLLEYVMNNHHLNTEPATTLQALQIALYFEHATGQFGRLYLDHRTGLAPEEEDNVKSLFLHGKMIQKMSTFILQKEMKLYFEPATGQFVGLYLDHRTGLEGESEQDESTDVSGVPEDMDLSDNGDGEDDMDLSDIGDGEDDTVDEGGGDTEDEGADGDEFGFNDGGDDSSDGGPMSLPIMLVVTSPPRKDRIGFVRNYFDCGSVHALELRVKGVLRRELNRDNYRISYFKHGPTDDGIEVDISGMSWGEVIESELQGAFAHDDLDPGHDAGASCSRPKRKREEPTYLKDYYTY